MKGNITEDIEKNLNILKEKLKILNKEYDSLEDKPLDIDRTTTLLGKISNLEHRIESEENRNKGKWKGVKTSIRSIQKRPTTKYYNI